MNRRISRHVLALAALTIWFVTPTFSAMAGEVRTEEITYKSGDESVKGVLAKPASPGAHPAIIVIHEWWGLNDFAKGKAKDFASKGYVALAIDLFRGQVTADTDTAHQLMRGLPEDRAHKDLKSAFAYLASLPDVRRTKIGAVGWCMGGGYALDIATAEPNLAAAVIYYGHLMSEDATIKGIKAPLLGNFAGLDKGIPPDSVKQFEAKAKALGKSVDFKIYPDVGHAFASSKITDAAAAKDADARTDAFFAAHLLK